MIPHSRILPRAKAKTAQRQDEHTDNWKVIPEHALAYGAIYKIERALINSNKEKSLDDLEDAYNYVAALWERKTDA